MATCFPPRQRGWAALALFPSAAFQPVASEIASTEGSFSYAPAAGAILGITVVPVLMVYLIRGRIPHEERRRGEGGGRIVARVDPEGTADHALHQLCPLREPGTAPEMDRERLPVPRGEVGCHAPASPRHGLAQGGELVVERAGWGGVGEHRRSS